MCDQEDEDKKRIQTKTRKLKRAVIKLAQTRLGH